MASSKAKGKTCTEAIIAQNIWHDLENAIARKNLSQQVLIYDLFYQRLLRLQENEEEENPRKEDPLDRQLMNLSALKTLHQVQRSLLDWQRNILQETGHFDLFDSHSGSWGVAKIHEVKDERSKTASIAWRGYKKIPPVDVDFRMGKDVLPFLRPRSVRTAPHTLQEQVKKEDVAEAAAAKVWVSGKGYMDPSEVPKAAVVEGKRASALAAAATVSGSAGRGAGRAQKSSTADVGECGSNDEANGNGSSSSGGGKKSVKASEVQSPDEDENDWICSECWQFETLDESLLLPCEGPCKRSFHLSCLGLKKMPQEVRFVAVWDYTTASSFVLT